MFNVTMTSVLLAFYLKSFAYTIGNIIHVYTYMYMYNYIVKAANAVVVLRVVTWSICYTCTIGDIIIIHVSGLRMSCSKYNTCTVHVCMYILLVHTCTYNVAYPIK